MNSADPYQAGLMIGQIVMAFLGLAILVFAVIAIVKAFTRKTVGWIVTAVLMSLLSLVMIAGALVAGLNRVVGSLQTQENKLVSPDGRFSLNVPGTWMSMPQIHEDASIGAGNVFASQFVIVLVEPKSILNMDLPAYAKLTTEAMAKSMTNGQLGDFEPVTISGHPALRRRVTGIMDGLNLTYQHTSVDTGDDLSQIMCWTIAPNEKGALPVFEKIAASFTAKPKPRRPAASTKSPAERVRLVAAEQLGVEESKVTTTSNLKTDLGADDLDLVEIVMAIEEEFNISVSDEEAEKWQNIGDIIKHVEKAAKAP